MPINPEIIEVIMDNFHNTKITQSNLKRWETAIGDHSDEKVISTVMEMAKQPHQVSSLSYAKLEGRLNGAVKSTQDTAYKPTDFKDGLIGELLNGQQGPRERLERMATSDLIIYLNHYRYSVSLELSGKNSRATYEKWIKWQVSLQAKSSFPDIAIGYQTAINDYWGQRMSVATPATVDPFSEINRTTVTPEKRERVDRGPHPRHPRTFDSVKTAYISAHTTKGRES